jgi:4'-phosphopantetheinyl transferase
MALAVSQDASRDELTRVEACGQPTANAWHPGPDKPSLSRATVHVWRGALDRLASRAPRLAAILTADELRKAEHYRFTRDRERFVAARALLRQLLGGYLASDPRHVRLVERPGGKPELAGMRSPGVVRFNVSHSEDVVLCAFTLDRHVGVDVERIRPAVAADTVAETFFSPLEVAALRALPPSLQPAAFFASWTRKEAYAKATGRGLSDGLDDARSDGPLHHLDRWSVRMLEPAQGYAAALVVEGHDCEPRLYDGDAVMD